MTVQRKTIKEVLLEVDPQTRTFYANVLKQATGLEPEKASGLSFEDSIHFFTHVWASCLFWSNQRVDYIGESLEVLENFLRTRFKSQKDLHDIQVFCRELKQLKGKNFKDIDTQDFEGVLQTTVLLQKFPSVGLKTAALIMRFLCLDSNYFSVEQNLLIPPLDRVNYRMCKQLLGNKETHDLLTDEKPAFKLPETQKFAKLGCEILGKNGILIDNLWFIGHFYCDSKLQNDCKLRKGVSSINFSNLIGVNLHEECPFYKYGCRKTK
jgi:hypothetical protein